MAQSKVKAIPDGMHTDPFGHLWSVATHSREL